MVEQIYDSLGIFAIRPVTAFHIAIVYGYTNLIQLFQSRIGPGISVDINIGTENGTTLLHWACKTCNLPIVQRLCAFDTLQMDVSAIEIWQDTPFLTACRQAKGVPIVNELLKYQDRFDVNAQSR